MERRDVLLGGSAALLLPLLNGCRHASGAGPAAAAASASNDALRALMEGGVTAGAWPGAVWAVANGADVQVGTAGALAVGSSAPMQRDTIFRIASMTKAVTAASVMMLVEDGKLTLDEKAERLLPELANRRVLKTLSSELDDTVPARSAPTVRQLMDFTFGSGLVFDPSLPFNKAAEAHGLVLGPPVPMTPHAPDEWMRLFGELPLLFQPGERWLYNTGSLVLGVLVRRAAGVPFETFVAERITGPLGMRDTAFHVPPEKLERFAGCGFFTEPQSGQKLQMDADGAKSAFAKPPAFASGAGGLVSTVDDYLAFARMLLKGGEHEGRRLLKEESVRAITTNGLTDAQRAASAKSLFPGMFDAHGWGFGVRVQLSPDAVAPKPGEYGWDGGFGTSWFTDPNGGRIAIALTQSADFLFDGSTEKFRAAAYSAAT